jgi:hypothetical protein
MMNRKEGVMLLTRNTEIDTRAPFRSVKEAVTLFGDKVLAGELYATATKLKHQVLYINLFFLVDRQNDKAILNSLTHKWRNWGWNELGFEPRSYRPA